VLPSSGTTRADTGVLMSYEARSASIYRRVIMSVGALVHRQKSQAKLIFFVAFRFQSVTISLDQEVKRKTPENETV
jgi:hypothetical protein